MEKEILTQSEALTVKLFHLQGRVTNVKVKIIGSHGYIGFTQLIFANTV